MNRPDLNRLKITFLFPSPQVTGEAQYADDIPLPANGLHGGLVLSTKPHAKLTRVDASEALQMPGVAGFFAAKDVPGGNAIGAAAHDEEVFATEKVTCVGQVRVFGVSGGLLAGSPLKPFTELAVECADFACVPQESDESWGNPGFGMSEPENPRRDAEVLGPSLALLESVYFGHSWADTAVVRSVHLSLTVASATIASST